MDAPCKIQGSIHVFRLVNNMCPGKWVHIKERELLDNFYWDFDYCKVKHVEWEFLVIAIVYFIY